MAREVNMIGMAIAKGLEERGQVGATHMGRAFDAWYPGYIDYAPMFKNIAAFWTETALFQYATPHTYTMQDFPEGMRDLRPRSLYASPWPPGTWRLRDAVDYMETASLSVLEFASKYKVSLLVDRYKAGVAQIALGAHKPPFAYIVRQDQRDPVAPVELLRRLAFGGIRVYQLSAAATIGSETFPAGTWIVPTDQEFAALAREVLDVQSYPDLRQYPGGPPERPYDAAGWTLPLAMGVEVATVSTPLSSEVRAKMRLLGRMPEADVMPAPYPSTNSDAASFDSVPGPGFDIDAGAAAILPLAGHIRGAGPLLVLDPAQNNAFRALNRAWAAGAEVSWSAGKYTITGLAPSAQEQLVQSLALQAERAPASSPPARIVKKPRIGLFQPWSGSMDEGWARWTLEQYGFSFTSVHPEDFREPFADRFDVIVIADDARIPVAGAPAGRGGPPRPEFAYQLTHDDILRIEQFVRRGGTLVCLGNASAFAIEQFKLPISNAVAGLPPEEFFLRGSLVEVNVDTAQPIMTGMPAQTAIFVDGGPVFDTSDGFEGAVLARYGNQGSPLLSGYLIGERHLNGKAAALRADLGDGRILLIGFRPEWRGQPFGTFRVLFNAIVNSR
jgi:hypothetical protein